MSEQLRLPILDSDSSAAAHLVFHLETFMRGATKRELEISVPLDHENRIMLGGEETTRAGARLIVEEDEEGNTGLLVEIKDSDSRESPVTLFGKAVTSLFVYKQADGSLSAGAINGNKIIELEQTWTRIMTGGVNQMLINLNDRER